MKFAQCCPLQNSIACQKFRVHTVTLGRPSLCDPNLQSLLLLLRQLLRRSLARRLLRLLRANPRPARRVKETSVPALPLARKRNMKKARPQGRARAAVPRKATRRIHRIKITLVLGPIPWLLRKAVANIDILSTDGCNLDDKGPGLLRGLTV